MTTTDSLSFRPFISVLFTVVASAALMAGCSSAPRKTTADTELASGSATDMKAPPSDPSHDHSSARGDGEPLAIIDAHTHTRFNNELERTSQIPMNLDQYLKDLRDAGVVGAIAHTGQDGENYHDLKAHNVLHCAGVGPKIDVKRLERGLRSGQYGCIKIYLGYVHQYAFDKNYEPAYKLAEKYDVPVVFHTGDTYSTQGKLKYADPLTIDEVAVDHPKVRFVIAHCGNPWIESAAEVAYKNPNVYLEGSALLIGNLNEIPKEKVDAYVVRPIAWIFGYLENPEKLMFGTDWPLTNIRSYADAFKRAIPKEHWKAVFHDNAVRVFKMNQKRK